MKRFTSFTGKALTVTLATVGFALATPDHSLLIPDAKDYIPVEDMGTSGHGSNAELVAIMEQLLLATHSADHVGEYAKNHMVGWYTTWGSNVTIANGDAFRIEEEKQVKEECVILCLELPESASSFEISFTSIGEKFGYSVWDYHANYANPTTPGEIHCRFNENSYSHKGSDEPITLSFTAHDHGFKGDSSGDQELITADYVFIMWNATPSEALIDINGIHAQYLDVEGHVIDYKFGLNVPEPATGALSLLALAALAARRRRA